MDPLDAMQEEYKKTQDPALRDKIYKELENRYEVTFDMDNPPPVEHKWIDRGLKLTCEIGTHPSHEIYKRK
jgi:hypothetical protein